MVIINGICGAARDLGTEACSIGKKLAPWLLPTAITDTVASTYHFVKERGSESPEDLPTKRAQFYADVARLGLVITELTAETALFGVGLVSAVGLFVLSGGSLAPLAVGVVLVSFVASKTLPQLALGLLDSKSLQKVYDYKGTVGLYTGLLSGDWISGAASYVLQKLLVPDLVRILFPKEGMLKIDRRFGLI